MNVTTHHIVLTKLSQRNLNEKARSNNIAHILKANNKAMQVKGWTLVTRPVNDDGQPFAQTERLDRKADDPNQYAYELHLTLQHVGDTEPGKTEHKAIAKAIHTHASNPLGGRWALASIDGIAYEVSKDKQVLSTKDFTVYAPVDMPDDFEAPFAHLYGVDSYIARIKAAVELALLSDFNMRFHVALIGPPGCGKSDMCETLATVFGEDAVLKFDGTQTTAAGAIKQIEELEVKPRFLIVEEIEKVAPEALSYLLALMDNRGEIRKTTAKKQIAMDARIMVLATVNNHELFEKLLAGALASRFANKLWFRHPDDQTVSRILTREIAKIDGDGEWIPFVVEYAKAKDIHDPRMLIALCLCGRDGWLDGSYVSLLNATDRPDDY